MRRSGNIANNTMPSKKCGYKLNVGISGDELDQNSRISIFSLITILSLNFKNRRQDDRNLNLCNTWFKLTHDMMLL